jgi:ABC-type arginine/histidine transport system permease subunit
MSAELGEALAGTLVLWTLSASLAILLALVLAGGSLSPRRSVRLLARSVINVTRGIPTVLLVIVAGFGMLRLPNAGQLPIVFPGTLASFQHVAWGVMLALALGSAGHLAEIFRAARAGLGEARLAQVTVMGMSRASRARLLAREAAAIALPATGARLVHHLHNTAFAALLPVTDLFGFIEAQVNATFRVLDFLLLGCGAYVALSALIWLSVRALEAALVHRVTKQPARRVAIEWSSTS